MKVLFASMAVVMTVAWSVAAALGDDAQKGPGGGVGGGGGADVRVGGGGGGGGVRAGTGASVRAPNANVDAGGRQGASVRAPGANVNVDGAGGAAVRAPGANVDVNRGNVNVDAGGRVGANVDANGRVGVNANRGPMLSTRNQARLGTSNFDRRGIGRLDESRFAGRNDNNWRYARWGDRWWYWLPIGAWAWWNGDRWVNYDADTYVDYGGNYSDGYAAPQTAVASGSSGPYYEDQGGFFYYRGGQKIYDPNIQRVADVGRESPR